MTLPPLPLLLKPLFPYLPLFPNRLRWVFTMITLLFDRGWFTTVVRRWLLRIPVLFCVEAQDAKEIIKAIMMVPKILMFIL